MPVVVLTPVFGKRFLVEMILLEIITKRRQGRGGMEDWALGPQETDGGEEKPGIARQEDIR